MLERKIIDNILQFVQQKPRTVQEIAAMLEKNWRTADRYVETITTETGLISTRVFREGTRGALKIVFWNALTHGKGSEYQERLLQKILNGRNKEDFSPFDIYQFVDEKKREAIMDENESPKNSRINQSNALNNAKNQVLFFSGNLSWIEQQKDAMKLLENLAKKKIAIKIMTRVDVTSKKKTNELLNINKRVGWDAVQIRHCEQPLRATIVDDNLVIIKEVMTSQRHRELKKNTFLFYRIEDNEWIEWLKKVFWHLWGQSVEAETRLAALETVNVK